MNARRQKKKKSTDRREQKTKLQLTRCAHGVVERFLVVDLHFVVGQAGQSVHVLSSGGGPLLRCVSDDHEAEENHFETAKRTEQRRLVGGGGQQEADQCSIHKNRQMAKDQEH